MNRKTIVLVAMLLAAGLLLSACGTPGGGGTGGVAVGNQGVINESGLSVSDEAAFPVDLPLPDGAYNVDVSAGGTQVSYLHAGTVQDMVTYLQTELPNYGWTAQTSPDSAIGAIASMLRKNDAGDTLSVNMQYNSNGDFTTLTMAILRLRK